MPGKAFDFDEKTRKSVSGIACEAEGTERRCLVVFDEGVRVQFATVGPGRFEATGRPIAVLGSGKELDAEGAATDGVFFYVIGSHAVKRNDCKSNPTSRHVVRFKVRPARPGLFAPGGSPRVEIDSLQDTNRLWALMKREVLLGQYAGGCLGTGTGGPPDRLERRPGLDIEGIAVQDGRLYLGFRSPAPAGRVPVYSVDAAALFDNGDARPRLAHLQVGNHTGIRDLVAGKRSILLLLGPDDDEPAGKPQWRVAEWTPHDDRDETLEPRILAELDLRNVRLAGCGQELKPEGLAILGETETEYRIIVLSDGTCDGAPLIFTLRR